MKTTVTRHKVNLISTISMWGSMKFMVTVININANFIEFLKRLIAKAEKPIFLILDSSSVHRSGGVAKFFKSTRCCLRLFFIPPYSPELNPNEHVWNYLKNQKFGRQVTTGSWDLHTRVTKVMRSLRKTTETIQSFFHHRWTMYTLISAN